MGNRGEVVLFCWHLGAEQEVTIQGGGAQFTVAWPDAQIDVDASAPIEVTQAMYPDCTLDKVAALRLRTQVAVPHLEEQSDT